MDFTKFDLDKIISILSKMGDTKQVILGLEKLRADIEAFAREQLKKLSAQSEEVKNFLKGLAHREEVQAVYRAFDRLLAEFNVELNKLVAKIVAKVKEFLGYGAKNESLMESNFIKNAKVIFSKIKSAVALLIKKVVIKIKRDFDHIVEKAYKIHRKAGKILAILTFVNYIKNKGVVSKVLGGLIGAAALGSQARIFINKHKIDESIKEAINKAIKPQIKKANSLAMWSRIVTITVLIALFYFLKNIRKHV